MTVASTSSIYQPRPASAVSARQSSEGNFMATLLEATGPAEQIDDSSSPGTSIDFHSATRQELFDWMNDQILTGKMSLEVSSPFLTMTFKLDAVTLQPVDMASDTTRIDFFERVEQGIEGAEWRNDEDAAARLRAALATMKRFDKGA